MLTLVVAQLKKMAEQEILEHVPPLVVVIGPHPMLLYENRMEV